ncbi:50S ribosomal protein L25 [Egicoccus halophilus]|uniref:Large ribosomal subunit protein bL25 n=1 Tax=Egicoccus halophilus TaxID=1670830 RepID=A0A8J3EQY7_9ACTN|nr:50S ribosomal protein L25 [Egicoccus halophilus]GGI03713.1 50S ribosomal protein L25 [Egicoccus halophilus]
MSKQVQLSAAARTHHGKGASGRLRREGRVPGIVYGYKVEPTAVSVDALELYHALHTEAGRNAMIRLDIEGATHLVIARDLQIHPIRQETQHVDFLAVDTDSQISVEVPVALVGEEDIAPGGGVVNQILYTVPVLVRPLDVPNAIEVSIEGMEIGDVKRIEDLTAELPEGAEFDTDPETTVITINAPVSEAELESLEEGVGAGSDDTGAEPAPVDVIVEPAEAEEA